MTFIQFLAANWIEFVGAILSLLYLYLSVRQKIGLWIFGFLCSALYAVVFFNSKFYADMSLQFYYMAVSIYGWIHWKKLSQNHSRTLLTVTKTTRRKGLILLGFTAIVWFMYYLVLSRFTDSPLPISDSLTTALSITATWMLTQKMLEHWLLWVFINTASAGLYFYKELYPTTVLFVIYAIMAIVGYRQWVKSMPCPVEGKHVCGDNNN